MVDGHDGSEKLTTGQQGKSFYTGATRALTQTCSKGYLYKVDESANALGPNRCAQYCDVGDICIMHVVYTVILVDL